jgi:hypothetical protein
MALATQADVVARLGRELDASETTRLSSLLEDASALVVGYARQDFEPAPYPTAVVGVVARMVTRVLSQGDIVPGLESTTEGAGPFSRGFKYGGGSSGDVWLSAADKSMLRPYRLGGGLTSVRLAGERYNVTPEV